MTANKRIVVLVVFITSLHCVASFSNVNPSHQSLTSPDSKWNSYSFASDNRFFGIRMSTDDNGVVELVEDDDVKPLASDQQVSVAPFLSQGEIADEVLTTDLSNPKQTRVILYIIISLVPVLFLIPLMLGSRDLIPLDLLPPVEI
mmetsp:Transcript_11351/g.13407  ORF Transcript_11351/g.13407 Transcript_11351/m.13407 type:complete len:145 (+) Transcript_11351:20-454(+)